MLDAIHEFTPEYKAQITVYQGNVNVSIICTSSYYTHTQTKLWVIVLYKSFGSSFRSAPRQIDWERADIWATKQLDLISRYATDIIVKPKELK